MRRLIAALSPAVLEQLGLGAALRQLVNRFRRLHPIRVRLLLAGWAASRNILKSLCIGWCKNAATTSPSIPRPLM